MSTLSNQTPICKDMEIAVIGGGLAGFAVAIMLKKGGFGNITIYERDKCIDERRQGYGLTLLQGINALKSIGADCFERVKALDTPSRSHYIFDHLGNIIGFFGTIFWPAPVDKPAPKANKKYNLHISRQNLRNILYEEFLQISSDASSIKWNSKLTEINSNPVDPNLLQVKFSNGLTTNVNLVIGCDGINSPTRKHKYKAANETGLNYLGILLVLGITYSDHFLVSERVFQTMDGHTRLFVMPFASDDSTQNLMWQLSFPLGESEAKNLSSNVNLLRDYVFDLCKSWHEPIPSMIQNTENSLIMGIPAYDRDPVLPKEHVFGNITLLGDAAHPMSPFKGQGANQALIDAVSFARSIQKSTSIQQAIEAFEAEMMTRVTSKVMLSRERVGTYHEANILNSENYEYRGASLELLNKLKENNIHSQSGESLEALIVEQMRLLNP